MMSVLPYYANDFTCPAIKGQNQQTLLAKGLSQDYDALKAGVTLPWSNGQTEGQINRLKLLKRQMFGRAGIELLSRRFLLAA